ncbi:hypothetical protein [Hymenobacter metallicola]|uniref:PH domain-containing protein n=1 Tax=Hymenobacter metallicola TaxID=2563114 RepID=A0A4Z0Q3L6_9BACT|nr:hypothetical protein [Hymenobacter metallicola]TGE23322.1 hypothetical protein E5K02_19195 [Hymenobacter metallicola]
MDAVWGWQHVDFYPDEVREQGPVTEAEALAAYAGFPWAAQLNQLAERRREGLTSTLPGLWFRRGPEQLTITSPDDLTVLLNFRLGEQQYEGELSLNWHAHTLEPEDVIHMLFEGVLAAWPGWKRVSPGVAAASPPKVLRFQSRPRSPWRALLRPLGLVVAVSVLAGATPLGWPIVVAGALVGLLQLGPVAWLEWQYARAGAGQQVEVDSGRHWLTLRDQHGTLEFGREQVRECVVVRSHSRSRSLNGYEYVCFVLTNHQVCIIPHLTGPAKAIAQAMGVQYRLEETGFPSIYHRRLSVTQLQAAEREHQFRLEEFRQRFVSCSSAQLRAILDESGRYTGPAVEAAQQLLQSRTVTND